MERMSSWSVKGRVPATAATGYQNNIFGDSSVLNNFFRLSPGTSYKWGGCKITSAPPAGFTCECKKVRLFVEMTKNTEDKFSFRAGSGAAAT